jgi:hypothetical protein
MGIFSRGWLDRIRGREPRPEAARTTARAREQEAEVGRPVDVEAVEEGAHAARDDVIRDEKLPPHRSG